MFFEKGDVMDLTFMKKWISRNWTNVASCAFWLFIVYCANGCRLHGTSFVTSHPSWAIVRWVPVWYKWVAGVMFVLVSLSIMFDLEDEYGDNYDLPTCLRIYAFEGFVILFVVAGAFWLSVVVGIVLYLLVLKGIDIYRNRRRKSCIATTTQDRPPEDEYTMQMRVFGTIPPMRTLYLTGSKCKVVTRRPDKEGEPQ